MNERGKAALERKKKKREIEGDCAKIKAYEDYKVEEAKVKLVHARERKNKGIATKSDEKLFKSRIVQQIENLPRQPPKKKQKKRKASSRGDESESSADDESDGEGQHNGRDLLGKSFVDEELGICTVVRRKTYRGDKCLVYSYEEDGETLTDFSSVAEVREWVEEAPTE